jgi:uncharacterized protein with gpF-like domain
MKKRKILRPIHYNRGIEAKYRSRLEKLIEAMTNSYEYWLKATYRKQAPAMASDRLPSKTAIQMLDDLAKRWIDKFDYFAPLISETYHDSMLKAHDASFKSALDDAGWAVEFKMTEPMRDAMNASIAENIALIKTIPVQYHSQVEGAVLRSYAAGRDLQQMVSDIQAVNPVTLNRATLIARDQSNKLNGTIAKARQLEVGITKALWMHSHAGKEPRPDHLAADGREYEIEKGCYISDEYINPGYMINCRCTSRPILPGLEKIKRK